MQNSSESAGGDLFEIYKDCSIENCSSQVWQRQRCYWLFYNQGKDRYSGNYGYENSRT